MRVAYERGLDVLVDEDLTEIFTFILRDLTFRTEEYLSYNPRREGEVAFGRFMKTRSGRPWLWQKY